MDRSYNSKRWRNIQNEICKRKVVEPLKRIGDSDKTGTTVRFFADGTIF